MTRWRMIAIPLLALTTVIASARSSPGEATVGEDDEVVPR